MREMHINICYLISGVVPAPFDLLTPDFKNLATGQLCLHTRVHRMYTHIFGILSALYSA